MGKGEEPGDEDGRREGGVMVRVGPGYEDTLHLPSLHVHTVVHVQPTINPSPHSMTSMISFQGCVFHTHM